jgi:hypothetical protein
MILNVPFKKKYWLLSFPMKRYEDIDVIIGIASLEKTCKELGVKLKDVGNFIGGKDNYDFITLFLFSCYVQSCQERYKKPKYNESHARYWIENISVTEMKKFTDEVNIFFGELMETVEKKK